MVLFLDFSDFQFFISFIVIAIAIVAVRARSSFDYLLLGDQMLNLFIDVNYDQL